MLPTRGRSRLGKPSEGQEETHPKRNHHEEAEQPELQGPEEEVVVRIHEQVGTSFDGERLEAEEALG